ncbi:hypothetical protein GCM10010486_49310 [Nonomuraea roseoviolacea subsp. carminata]
MEDDHLVWPPTTGARHRRTPPRDSPDPEEPGAEPHAVPRAEPPTEPWAVPQAVPRAEAQADPWAVPRAEPRAVPRAVPARGRAGEPPYPPVRAAHSPAGGAAGGAGRGHAPEAPRRPMAAVPDPPPDPAPRPAPDPAPWPASGTARQSAADPEPRAASGTARQSAADPEPRAASDRARGSASGTASRPAPIGPRPVPDAVSRPPSGTASRSAPARGAREEDPDEEFWGPEDDDPDLEHGSWAPVFRRRRTPGEDDDAPRPWSPRAARPGSDAPHDTARSGLARWLTGRPRREDPDDLDDADDPYDLDPADDRPDPYGDRHSRAGWRAQGDDHDDHDDPDDLDDRDVRARWGGHDADPDDGQDDDPDDDRDRDRGGVRWGSRPLWDSLPPSARMYGAPTSPGLPSRAGSQLWRRAGTALALLATVAAVALLGAAVLRQPDDPGSPGRLADSRAKVVIPLPDGWHAGTLPPVTGFTSVARDGAGAVVMARPLTAPLGDAKRATAQAAELYSRLLLKGDRVGVVEDKGVAGGHTRALRAEYQDVVNRPAYLRVILLTRDGAPVLVLGVLQPEDPARRQALDALLASVR